MKSIGARFRLRSANPKVDHRFYTKVLGFDPCDGWNHTEEFRTVFFSGLMITFCKTEFEQVEDIDSFTIDLEQIEIMHSKIKESIGSNIEEIKTMMPGIKQFSIQDSSGREISFVEPGPVLRNERDEWNEN